MSWRNVNPLFYRYVSDGKDMSHVVETFICPSKIAADRKWKKLHRLMRNMKPFDDGKVPPFACKCELCLPHRNLLHLVCNHEPPLSIIDKLLAIFPEFNHQLDKKYRLPLHVVMENRAKYSIVKSLLMNNRKSGSSLDIYGRSPLMSYFDSRSFCSLETMVEICEIHILRDLINMGNIINLIKDASFSSIMQLDQDGKGVVEYALIQDAHVAIVKILTDWHAAQSRLEV